MNVLCHLCALCGDMRRNCDKNETLLLVTRPATRGGDRHQPGSSSPPKFSRTHLIVRYNNELQSLCPRKEYNNKLQSFSPPKVVHQQVTVILYAPENTSWLRACS